jgi:trk system potassium uptake protein TrkH
MRISPSLLQSPARLSITGFAILILFGTALLMLPSASTTESLGFVNALFTATSATCVTGLVVMDTGKGLTTFGQLTILGLIQVGGLGIMTLSTLFLLMARRRPSLAGRVIIQDTFTQGGDRSLPAILRDVALFTLMIEGIGMTLMFFRFFPENGATEAFYLSAFHAVSAFCNAGFSLFSESFVAYRDDWILNLVICFLIIIGGIGFLVISELKRSFPFNDRPWSRLSLHSKLVLSTTATLLLFGSLLIFLMERHNSLSALSLPGQFLAAFFQAVSARTAGFNTISIGNLANETLFILILLMFVGGSPGSCAGGIKTTTLACLAILGISRLRGQENPQLFRRTIAQASVGKAISVVMVSMVVVVAGIMILLMTEIGEVAHPLSRGKFLEFFFEVISAFGTVGLSTGVTGDLTTMGKLVLTFVMFVGRLGPLVVAMAVSRQKAPRYYYAEERIMIG